MKKRLLLCTCLLLLITTGWQRLCEAQAMELTPTQQLEQADANAVKDLFTRV